jgi:cytoskeletal protein CcmA (bactofilin family)
MFRRKEDIDNLFDTNAEDNGQAPAESVNVIQASGSQASAPIAAAPVAAPQASAAPLHTPSQPVSRPQETRSAAPTASAFRPNSGTPMGNDLARNRMPEAKTPMSAMSAGNVSSVSSAPVEKASKGARRVLTVGNDILLKGEIATCDRLVIEGKVDATLNDVHTVEIAETGSFKGSAQIEDAEISGLFEGDLVVRNRLVIYATGKVRGKITYGEIEIERGGELTGEIKTMASQPATGARPARPATATPMKENKFEAA